MSIDYWGKQVVQLNNSKSSKDRIHLTAQKENIFFSFLKNLFSSIYIFIQLENVILHLRLLQNIGYIPRVVQYILVAYLRPNSLYLLIPHPYTGCPPSPHW